MARTLRLCLAFSILVAAAACGPKKVSTHERPQEDFVRVLRVSPPEDTVLARGQPVAVDVFVGYQLVSADEAFLKLAVKDDADRPIAEFERHGLSRGSGTWRFAGTVTVPDTAAIAIVLEMYELRKPPIAVIPTTPEQSAQARLLEQRIWPVRKAVTELRLVTR